MKRLITIIGIMLIVTVFASETSIMKKFGLGKTVRQIYRKKGKATDITQTHFTYLNKKMAGFNCEETFYHHQGRIFMVAYFFKTSKDECIADYFKLNALLIKKYGTFTKDITWENDLFRKNPRKYGLAVSVGHLKVKSYIVMKNRVSIFHRVYGSKYHVHHVLLYIDRRMQSKYLKWQKEKNESDL